MIEYDQNEKQFRITIPLSNIRELQTYQRGILGILKEIEIEDSKPELVACLKSVYQLLGHFMIDERFVSQIEDLLPPAGPN